ncbi:MAG: FeoC-like transcriptional regulator [Gammaproteobacteria bacterium]|nr:FeoC-like transcriptional regulator [Gammaproteobacteria bacterium]MBL7000204.1 FeoC-like transcriptional regulator [Gammaproteobacteria bacterium]
MILKEVKTYLQTQRQASLSEMAIHFDIDADALKGMLEFWVKKGIIRHTPASAVCSSGCSCSQKEQNDLYSYSQQFGSIPVHTR